MQRFENAIESLERVLTAESAVAVDPWLSARAARLERERNRLLTRLAVLRTTLGDSGNPGDAGDPAHSAPVRTGLSRLALDVRHHHQRVTDLTYDALALDVGGSD